MVRETAVVLAAALAMLAGTASAQEPPPRQFYGVVSQGELESRDWRLMGAGRVGTVRLTLPWAEVDPGPLPNDYSWSRFDSLVAAAAREGISVLPTIYTVPHWVSALERCEGPVNGPCAITPPRSEVGLNAWRSFVGGVVRRYGYDGVFWAMHPELPALPIRAWQIWNEQNAPGFYQPRPDVGDYARLLSAAADAIREEDPYAEVVLGGLFPDPPSSAHGGIPATDFLARLYRRAGSEADFDGVAVHPYAARLRGVKRAVKRIARVVRAEGDSATGIWITEVGWASGGRPTPLNRGLRGQAARLSQAFRWLTENRERLGLQTVLWYAWRDVPLSETLCAWCARSGLFRGPNLLAKPSWESFLQFTGGR